MRERITLFLCGDVMTGRGIDQVLPHPVEPTLHEMLATSALDYVQIAEEANGPIRRPADFRYVWGDALAEIERREPDWRIANLETSITTSERAEPKGINYRMNPRNVGCLQAARLDCCVLANNHVLDWGAEGLLETLDTLGAAGIPYAGAGRDVREAEAPVVLGASDGPRVLVFGLGAPSSGVSAASQALPDRPGVAFLPDVSPGTAHRVAERILADRRPDDIVVVSIHWGGNWGYDVPDEQRAFAHALIDAGAADLVHGHSSHHPKGMERYRGRLILYGCGDFINDYEGIAGHEEYRAELVIAYFATLEAGSGRLLGLTMAPFRTRRFRLERADTSDAEWLRETLSREGASLGTELRLDEAGALRLHAEAVDGSRA